MRVQQIIFSACLLGLAASSLAMTVQCKTVKTGIQQCEAQGSSATKLYAINNMPYALCAKALCTIDKKDATKASCLCPIHQSKGWQFLSFSPNAYQQAKPQWNKKTNTNYVQSNFSLADQGKTPKAKNITCKSNQAKPWVDCFGIKCKVDSHLMATCICPVKRSKVFAISGPGKASKCDVPADKAWSGIDTNFASSNTAFILQSYQKLYPTSPVSQ